MKKITAISILFYCLFANSVWAAGIGSGLVQTVLVQGTGGNGEGTLIFRTDVHANYPACNTAGDYLEWAVSLEKQYGRAMLSTVLAAQAQGLQVTVIGTGSCTDWPDRETPVIVRIGTPSV